MINIYNYKLKWAFGVCAAVTLAFYLWSGDSSTLFDIVKSSIFITMFLTYLFNIYLWKYVPEPLIGVPDLNGTWKGKADYQWVKLSLGENGKGSVDPVYLVVKQNFLSTKILAFTKESTSYSLSTNISISETGAWVLSYMYDNSPGLGLIQRSPRHRGAAQLKANKVSGQYHLEGDYWTDRWSQGNLTFLERKKKFATDYNSASQIFEKPPCT